MHVGGSAGYKNFETLLRAYAGLPALAREFDLVAFGGGDFDEKERALIGALGLSDTRVRQIGGGDSLLASLYQGAANSTAGGCPLFPGKQVAAKGWCSAYAKKG